LIINHSLKPASTHLKTGVLICFLEQLCSTAKAQTIYVKDGDTIYLNGQSVRLEGIDAPEKAQRCTGPKGQEFKCGLAAKRQLIEIVGQGPVQCQPSGFDLYGRTLAHCKAGNTELNSEMVARGYARAFIKYSGEYLEDESEAQTAKRGLWAGRWQAPWDWRASHKNLK
jgi:endonuclease YncB( thermonuclease family)